MRIGTPRDQESLESVLATALSAQLQQEAERLKLQLKPARIEAASYRLLETAGPARGDRKNVAHAELDLRTGEDFQPHDYLHLVPDAMRRVLGQVVTPQPIAQYILRAAGYREDGDILGKTLCDPACGSGIFLVEAVRTHLRALRRSEILLEEWYPRVRARFVGIDIDPIACLYARFNLSLLLAPAILDWMRAHPRALPEALPVRHQDTLAALASEMGADGFLPLQEAGPRLSGSFDFVVGNPPYRKLGQMDPVLRSTFGSSIYGHANAYGVFLHAGIEMLRPNGRLGFIVPRSMLSGLYFQNLRRLIEEETRLEELSLLVERKNVFPQVLQGTMIVVLRRPSSGEAGAQSIRTGVVRSVNELSDGGPCHVRAEIGQVARRLNGTTVWFVSDREQTYSLIDKIIDHHPLLGSPGVACPAKTGPVVWNRVKADLRSKAGRETLPLVWATDVSRFRFRFGSAEETRPAYLAETQKTRGLSIAGPSVLVQRVTADEQARRIVVSRASFSLRERYFVENHLNVLQPLSLGRKADLGFILGILSSDVIEFLFRSMNGNTQVSATEINLLPIPRGLFEAEIADLVARLEESAAPAARQDLEEEMNDRVARAYGLSRRDLGFLQRALHRDD